MLPEEIDEKSKCCFNCKWFETRTCFCRLNPPQIVLQRLNAMSYPSSIFPKISVPNLDWCSNFRNIHDENNEKSEQ